MDGGLALMRFRMLFWVCGLALVFSHDTTGATATARIQSKMLSREGDNVTLKCEISSIQQTNDVLWKRRTTLQDHNQTRIVVNKYFTDNRFSSSKIQVVNSTAGLYSHNITINSVKKSDQGYYQCFPRRSTQTIAHSTEVLLIVLLPNEFPVCFPHGPATVTIDSSLSCKTLSDTRKPIVSDIGMPTATNDGWVTSPTNGGGCPEKELIKTVTNSEHGQTFQCNSTSDDPVDSIACEIGPLIVVSGSTKVPQSQNCSSYIAVFIVSIVIHLITIILLYCQYDPRRWQKLQGMLRRSSTPRQGNDHRANDPGVQYEIPIPRTATPQRVIQPPEPVTPGTTSSPCRTARHFYHNRITEPTSSS